MAILCNTLNVFISSCLDILNLTILTPGQLGKSAALIDWTPPPKETYEME